MNTLQVANTIKAQISARELMALGATKFSALTTGGLAFHVSLFGSKKAIIAVKLDQVTDTYNVELYTGRLFKKAKEVSEVYCDQLTETISTLCEAHFAGKLSSVKGC